MTIMVSTAPPPSPPRSSGNGAPRMPSSLANAFQWSARQPLSDFRIARRDSKSYLSLRKLATVSRSIDCSSVKLKSIWALLRQALPLVERIGVGDTLADQLGDFLRHAGGVRKHLFIANPEHPVPTLLEPSL